jgi:hypothetical protein
MSGSWMRTRNVSFGRGLLEVPTIGVGPNSADRSAIRRRSVLMLRRWLGPFLFDVDVERGILDADGPITGLTSDQTPFRGNAVSSKTRPTQKKCLQM